MDNRPFTNYYEPDENGIEQLVSRELNDEEWAEYLARQEAELNKPAPEHPLLAIVRALSDDDKAVLKELLS